MKRISTFLVMILIMSPFQTVSAADDNTGSPFPDVYSGHVNAEAIEYLKNADIIEGYPDGEYKPTNDINRAEFTKILIGAISDAPQGSNCFSDVTDQWFAPYICEAKDRGIIDGYPDGTFKPADQINFSEASKIIANTFELEASDAEGERWFKEYVEALAEEKAIPFSVKFFDEDVTRDEMAEMIWRLKADIDDKATRSYEEITGESFVTVDSCADLTARFQSGRDYYYFDEGFLRGGEFEFAEEDAVMNLDGGEAAPAPEAPALSEQSTGASKAQDESSDDYSATNLQVAGVDEADIIKNDGKYIYIIKSGTIRIVDAFPADNMEELVTITLGEENDDFWPTEMYVDGDRLVVIGSVWRSTPLIMDEAESMIAPPYNYSNRVVAYVLNITDRTKPTVDRTVEFDGNYSTSRKVNDTLYMVVNQGAYYPYYYYDTPELFENEDLIPLMKDSKHGEDELIAPCNEILIMPKEEQFNFLITAAIPLNSDADVARNVMVGNAETAYASRNNMYITATDWSGGWERDTWDTAIYRFALGINSIKFEGRGKVPGTVLNQFSMDEHAGNFRVATTTNNFSGDVSNNLYVLDQGMNLVGDLENIAPGESIYSVRFMGNKAYMVTFKRVDPLFVIGLEDPTDPEILGELKIPGFSNYLHPYDENTLIGFGKEVDPGDTDVADEDFLLWNQVQGLKVGIFDVSDVNNPKELFSEVIGDQGTESQLLYNHKALLFDKEKELLAFPISVYEYQDTNSCQDSTYSSCPSDCRKICVPSSCTFEDGITVCTTDCDGRNSCVQPELEFGQKVFEGAYVYNINLEDGLTLKGRINHHNEDDLLDLSETGWVDYTKAIDRILYIGQNLYTVSQWGVKANDLNDLEEINFIELAGNSDNGFYPEPIPFVEDIL